EVIVGASIQPLDAIPDTVTGGQDQNRQACTHAANGGDEAQAIAIGESKVEHHGVIRHDFNERGCIIEARSFVNAEPTLYGSRTDVAPQGGISLDNQDPHPELLSSSRNAASHDAYKANAPLACRPLRRTSFSAAADCRYFMPCSRQP